MRMKNAFFLVFGLAAILATYLIFAQKQGSGALESGPRRVSDRLAEDVLPDLSELHRSGPENEVPAAAAAPARQRYSELHEAETMTTEKLAISFLEADSAVEADNAIAAAEQMGIAAAKDWRLSLDTMCNPSELSYLEENLADDQAQFVEKALDYCAGYEPEYNIGELIEAGELQRLLDDRHQVKQRDHLLQELGDLSGSSLGRRINDFVRDAQTPEDLAALAEYLQIYYEETGEVLWRPAAGTTRISDMFVSSLQAIALELYSCQRFGGCGPDSMKVTRICAFSQTCEPGWNYEQFVFANHSPLEMEYIQRVLAHLHAL